jgi:uncharacterized membrane protein
MFMSWLDRYRCKLYLRTSIWIFPALSIVVGLIAVILLHRLDRSLGWELDVSQETARMIMSTIAASMLTLVVVTSSAVLLVVQLASAQLTPRVIMLVYRDKIRKLSLSIFVFTFTFSVGVLVRIEGTVPLLTSYIAAYGFLINLALFLYFIDSIGKAVRPSSVLRFVGLAGREVVENVYPQRLKRHDFTVPKPIEVLKGNPTRFIRNRVDGVLLAFDRKGLVALAQSSNCVIELVPEVGDFVAAHDPLFRIFDGGQELPAEHLRTSVALGQERTLEQDPMYAFRIIVDIASKALSPAINDPTTAVLAIDQIHHLLRDVGSRNLAETHDTDWTGLPRLVYRTPNWDDFVHLAVTEIRQYGRDSIQIMRRLRAMLENLIETLPKSRAQLLRVELSLLESSSKRIFPDLNDQVLAEMGDLQGMGGGDKRRDQNISAIA